MNENDFIKYFGQKTYKSLLEFYKVGALERFIQNEVSLHNIEIILDYLKDMRREGWEEPTIINNAQFLSVILINFKQDLDKLTQRDVEEIIDFIVTWKKKDGEPLATISKNAYKIFLKRFLGRYAEMTKNEALLKLSAFKIKNCDAKRKLPEDMLSETEINQMIAAAKGPRDKALIAVLYESGARVGEIVNCRVKDVRQVNRSYENWYYITLNGKTGARQVMIYKYQMLLRNYLNSYTNNPNAPLFSTTREYGKHYLLKDQQKNEKRERKPLKSKIINNILKSAAKTAGFDKNVHPHLLRHSQGTRMANIMTDQQLKTFMGWKPGSNMAETYIHLAGRDIDAPTLKSWGVVLKEDTEAAEKCPQCGNTISPTQKYCDYCGLPQSEEAKQSRKEVERLTNMILTHPDFQDMRDTWKRQAEEKKSRKSQS